MEPLDFLLGVTVAVTWGLGITLAKAGMAEFPPIFLVALRFTVTALALVWFVKPPFGAMRRILLISVVVGTLQYSLTFTGINGIDASLAAIVIQLEVPFSTLLAVIFLGDRLGWRRATGLAIAFGGVVLIAWQPGMQGEIIRFFLVMAGAFTWAAGNILIKKLGSAVGGFQLIAWVAVFTAPQLFAVSLFVERGQARALANADFTGWGTVLYLGLVMTAFGYGLWYRLLGRHEVSHVMPFLLLLPVASIAGAILLLGESPSLQTFAGAIFVIGGVGFILYRQMRGAGVTATAPQALPPD